jgi:hypothetical protein
MSTAAITELTALLYCITGPGLPFLSFRCPEELDKLNEYFFYH